MQVFPDRLYTAGERGQRKQRGLNARFGRSIRSSVVLPATSRFRRPGICSSSRTCTGEERLLGLLQGRYGLLAGYGREILEELGQRLARFQVVQQRRERHARADEHRRPTHYFGIAVNDRLALLHSAPTPGRGDRFKPVYRSS